MFIAIIGLIIIFIGLYIWVKIPEKSKKKHNDRVHKEEYMAAMVVKSLGVYREKRIRSNEKRSSYFNKLVCSYWDMEKNEELEFEINRPCGFNEPEMSYGEKIVVYKDKKNGQIEFVSDGLCSTEKIIDDQISGEVFIVRFILVFWIAGGSIVFFDSLRNLL